MPTFSALIGVALIAAHAQTSATCQFAILAWLEVRLELEDARTALEECRRSRSGCKVEEARAKRAKERLELLGNYWERYCSR